MIIRSTSKIKISFIKSRKTNRKTTINAQKTTIKNETIIVHKIINQTIKNLFICHRFSFSLIMRTRQSILSRRTTRRLDKKHRFTSRHRTMIRSSTRSLTSITTRSTTSRTTMSSKMLTRRTNTRQKRLSRFKRTFYTSI